MLAVTILLFGGFGTFLYIESKKDPAFAITVPMKIAEVEVKASVAKTLPERIQGLSDTKALPKGVVKLFMFNANGYHSIWMKDMNYAIDILWVDEAGKIVHIEENITPDTYPDSFTSNEPAFYVIETNAGFAQKYNISVGEMVELPK